MRHKASTYSDIDLKRWKEYPEILTDSLWLFGSRASGNGHSFDYHGNFVPQIATQLLMRYSKAGEIVLDLFLGSGTTAIEAMNLGRKVVGVEIDPGLVEHTQGKLQAGLLGDARLICGDSTASSTAEDVRRALRDLGSDYAHLLILHPPYWDIIRFSDEPGDLSHAGSVEEFLEMFARAAQNGCDLLAPGRFAALVIGDKYSKGELVPLGFLCMQKMNEVGFRTKSIIVKNIEGNEIGKGRSNNLWRYRALAGGFYIFKHEYIMLFTKPD